MRKVFYVLGGLLVLLALLNARLLRYAYVQAAGQIKIILNALPVEEALKQDRLTSAQRYKIDLILEARDFAVNELGLAGHDNYASIYFQDSEQLMWVVTAAEPFAMKAYEWHFPLFGSFSYKGFFEEEMAQKESQKLSEMGYDTDIRNAGGWSTLGILKDPILSSMLDRDTASLVDLIIHELTHTTVYVKNDVAFNENLATFIGQEGTKLFLARKFGMDSPLLGQFESANIDREIFSSFVIHGAMSLDSLYGTMEEQLSDSIKKEIKAKGITSFTQAIQDVEFRNKRYYNYFDNFIPNNTFFMSYLRYRGDLDTFRREFEANYNQDLKEYIRNIKLKYGR